ncbi:MAG: hypothetical protein RIR70_311 [Pseudomonadota bacterium]|jgi:beta-RFAP synthase
MSILDSERLLSGDTQVGIEAPGRLHLGFVDLHGGMGRRFGSVGLALDWPSIKVSARHADNMKIEGLHAERATRMLQHLHEHFPFPATHVLIEGDAPAHQGLGAGSQLAIAVSVAVCRLHGIQAAPRQIAELIDRGAQSGIGVAIFEEGGFVVDGGRGTTSAPPPLVSRMDFPAHWRVILVLDSTPRTLPLLTEQDLLKKLPPFPPALADRLCRELLMRALPAVAEEDFENFSRAIGEIQRCVGDYFAPIQGGRFTSPQVAAVLERFEAMGAQCVGQSAWGPTGFAIVDSETFAHLLVRDAKEIFGNHLGACQMHIVSARNHGAQVSASWQPRVVPNSNH